MNQIFSKTAKGQEEIKTRAAGLSQRSRQVLIFVDGKRTRGDLHSMLKGDDLDALLASLVEQGFIEVSGVAEASPAAKEAPAPQAAQPVPAVAKPAAPTPAPAPAAARPAPALSPEEQERRRKEQERLDELAMARSFLGKMS